jgi:O-methyltransferase involved in polyketide biosynthesis
MHEPYTTGLMFRLRIPPKDRRTPREDYTAAMAERRSESISPTAHYTGYVWFANGLSHPAFATRTGRMLHRALRPANAAARAIGQPTLDGMLLARHRVIDHLLERAIAAGRVSQVIEVAAGLSPRGWRFAERHGDAITYVEADLPDMAETKRAILADASAGAAAGVRAAAAHHRVVEIDALADHGPRSIAALADTLDPSRGTAIITEGLVNYFDAAQVAGMWRRFAAALARFPDGLYLSDLILAGENRGPMIGAFQLLLSAFVRGKVHMHWRRPDDATAVLRQAGFARAALHRPVDLRAEVGAIERGGGSRVRIIEANVR